jgi:hypothetical protein
VPAGAVLPLTAEARDFSRLHDEPSRCVRIFPGRGSGKSCFTLYEDDRLSLRHREGDFTELDFRLDWDGDAVRLRLAKRGSYALPCDTVTVALPAAERRRPVLESEAGAPPLVAAIGNSIRWTHEHAFPAKAKLMFIVFPAKAGIYGSVGTGLRRCDKIRGAA